MCDHTNRVGCLSFESTPGTIVPPDKGNGVGTLGHYCNDCGEVLPRGIEVAFIYTTETHKIYWPQTLLESYQKPPSLRDVHTVAKVWMAKVGCPLCGSDCRGHISKKQVLHIDHMTAVFVFEGLHEADKSKWHSHLGIDVIFHGDPYREEESDE